MLDINNKEMLEKYSSAITLSDMEIFIFPEIMYSVVLSNIMSDIIWEWKKDPWFKNIDKMNSYRKILRIKQYIMDNFVFNLDLDTWGLTTKEKELDRFNNFIDLDILSRSNALFGYEGDKYYFDIDIRQHFGLDKYDGNIIPYWKTETIEAMQAFRYKEGYNIGAGECVSFATLYAAALFVIGEIPLEDIFLLGTPLHSQNFVMVNDGIVTNNRRIVTKNMWFNGTEMSFKAKRAIQNENVTFITNNTGYIHIAYDNMTIEKESYKVFEKTLIEFLKIDVNFEILANFLRQNVDLQKYFQFKCDYNGKSRYIKAEDLYNYENNSIIKLGQSNQCELIKSIDEDNFYVTEIKSRTNLSDLDIFFKNNKINLKKESDLNLLKSQFTFENVDEIMEKLVEFCEIVPSLPNLSEKKYVESKKIDIKIGMTREEIINYLESIREENITADLAFYAFRDMSKVDYTPFIKANFERNPVSIDRTNHLDINNIYEMLNNMENMSIYKEEYRLAQADEVYNFYRGDGFEKLLFLLNVALNRDNNIKYNISLNGDIVTLDIENQGKYEFKTAKKIDFEKFNNIK